MMDRWDATMTLFLLLHTTSPWGATAPADAGALLNTRSGSPRTIDEELNGASVRDGPLPPRSSRGAVSLPRTGLHPASGGRSAVAGALLSRRDPLHAGRVADYRVPKRHRRVSCLRIVRNWTDRLECSRPTVLLPKCSGRRLRRSCRAAPGCVEPRDTRLAAGVQANSFLIEEAYNQEAGVVAAHRQSAPTGA